MDFVISTEVLDASIQDARNKKQTIATEMNYMMNLMRDVELKEKAAEKAKQEFDNYTLVALEEMDELILAEQQTRVANDKRAREVYAQKISIATEMSEIQFRVSDVLKGGDGCVASINEMCELLEKRLTSAILEKKTADKQRLKVEAALAYQKNQVAKLAQESKKLEQEARDNLKLREFLVDRGHVVNMLLDEITNNCQDVHLLKSELGIPQDENETTEDYLRPIMQEMARMQDCEWWKKDSELTQEPKDLHIDQMDKNKRNKNRRDSKYAYNISKIKKLEEELKKLKRKAMEDVKLQELLLMKEEIEDYQNEIGKVVHEDYLKPIMPMHDSQCNKEGNVAGSEEKGANNIVARNVNLPEEDIFYISQNTNPIEDYLDEIAKLVTEDNIFKDGMVSTVYASPNLFAICLPGLASSSSGATFFNIGGPYYFFPGVDLSSHLVYTPLILNPIGFTVITYSGHPSDEYFIGLTSININDKPLEFNHSLLTIDENGFGGTRLSTVTPYMTLETSIYNAFIQAFVNESAMLNLTVTDPVSPFEVCYAAGDVYSTPIGPAFPMVDLVMHSEDVFWRILGANSMVSVAREEGDLWCLGFVDGGETPRSSVVIGGHQMDDNLLQFDLVSMRLGFSSSVLVHGTNCASFNFTSS